MTERRTASDDDSHLRSVYIDLESNSAQDPISRVHLTEELRKELDALAPEMIERLGELSALIVVDEGDFWDLLPEMKRAYQFGLWRSVVALVRIGAERFTDVLYDQIGLVNTPSGKRSRKEALFGERVTEQRKLVVLEAFGLITEKAGKDLDLIRRLRNRYVHEVPPIQQAEKDAQQAMKTFWSLLSERFDSKFTIARGRIVPKEQAEANPR